MFATQSKPIAAGARPAADSKTDITRFKPTVAIARRKVDELVSRGAAIVHVHEDKVEITRMGKRAVIDACGRVQWST